MTESQFKKLPECSDATTLITIDNGETFEGTPDQFRDCFFDNAELDTIYDWCQEQGMKFKVRVCPK